MKMKDIVIVGAGGLGREVACLLRVINSKEHQWNLVGFIDDGLPAGSTNPYGRVLGGIDFLNSYSSPLSVVIAIGNPRTVRLIFEKITSPFVDFPNLVSPDVVFLDKASFKMGKGNILSLACTISCNVSLGDFNLLNSKINIGHDTVIGNYNALMPGVAISGEVSIGNGNFFGVASVVLQGLKIGENTTVGANSLIIRKTKDGQTYIGSPASIMKLT